MFPKKSLTARMTLVCSVYALLQAATVHAINLATAAKPPPGYQLKIFPFYYSADSRTNKDGDPAVTDLGLKKYGVMIGNCYQIGNLQLSAIVPVGKLEIGKLKSDDAGLGDIQLRAGWYLPVAWASLLPMLMLKVPSGSFEKSSKANFGDGQADLATELFFFKLLQPFSFDAVLKYNVRFRNPDTDVTPGNEFIAEGLVTYRLADRIRIGPALNFLAGINSRKGGHPLANSGPLRFAAGGELWYGRFDHVKISLAAYQDLLTRNTNEGILVMSRLAFQF